jgi:hypothetical protein
MGSSADTSNKLTNGAIFIISTVLKHVMSLAAEAEIGEVFINTKEGTVLCPHHWKQTIPLPQDTAMVQ